jgi:hypothetical protein
VMKSDKLMKDRSDFLKAIFFWVREWVRECGVEC